MPYTAPLYPTDIPDYTDLREVDDNVDSVLGSDHNDLMKELVAIATELGTLPKGSFTSVKSRLDAVKPGYVDRGDVDAYDWTLASFTTDATWRDLDCSAIVPAGAKGIIFRVTIQDDAVGSYFGMRNNAYTSVYTPIARTQVANVILDTMLTVGCDTNRIVEYTGANLTFTAINVVVLGWFI